MLTDKRIPPAPVAPLWLIPVGALFALALLAGCGGKIEPGETPIERTQVPAAATEVVTGREIPVRYEASGTVRSRETSGIAPRVMGVIEEIPVREGDSVTAGQVLVRITSDELEARRNQARAAVTTAEASLRAAEEATAEAGAGRDLAEATHQRYRMLHEERAVSDQEYETVFTQATIAKKAFHRMKAGREAAAAGLEQARAGLREAEAWAGFSEIRAPADGRVIRRNADPGSMAMPGMAILEIGVDGGFRLEASVDESLIDHVRGGAACTVAIPARDLLGEGEIVEVVPSVDRRTGTFLIKIELPAAWAVDLADGMYGTASIVTGRDQKIMVDVGAVGRMGQLDGVYTVDDQRVVRFRPVRTGRRQGDRIEILSGLAANDRVVVTDLSLMRDGAVMAQESDRNGATAQ